MSVDLLKDQNSSSNVTLHNTKPKWFWLYKHDDSNLNKRLNSWYRPNCSQKVYCYTL